jgi:hypothetical protein
MRRNLRRLFVALSVAQAFALTAPGARAQGDPPAARTLFDEGRKLAAEKKYSAACPKFEESYKLDPGIGTLFNLADCWEHIGRTASAWVRFREVTEAAVRAGQADRERIARERAATLEPRLSRLVVDVKAGSSVEVTKDGAPFGAAQWGTSLPVDPGPHTIEAREPSKQPWKKTVEVPPTAATTTVTVPPLENELAKIDGAQRTGGGLDAVLPVAPSSSAESADGQSFKKTLGWAMGGVGAIGIAIGTVYGLKVIAKNEEADGVCPTSQNCSLQDGIDYRSAIDEATDARTVSIVGFAAGGGALATAAVLLLTSSRPNAARIAVTPSFASAMRGVAVQATW